MSLVPASPALILRTGERERGREGGGREGRRDVGASLCSAVVTTIVVILSAVPPCWCKREGREGNYEAFPFSFPCLLRIVAFCFFV